MVEHPPGPTPIHDVLPIFLCERGRPGKPLAATGTGFLISDGLLITCWHCVRGNCPTGPADSVRGASESRLRRHGPGVFTHRRGH